MKFQPGSDCNCTNSFGTRRLRGSEDVPQTMKPRAIVLVSGGMDSCVCAALAARDFEAAALHVSYGQRTEERERRAFDGICDRLGIRRRLVVRNQALREIGGSALIDSSMAVPQPDDNIGNSV